jgi:hypothetical protein
MKSTAGKRPTGKDLVEGFEKKTDSLKYLDISLGFQDTGSMNITNEQ